MSGLSVENSADANERSDKDRMNDKIISNVFLIHLISSFIYKYIKFLSYFICIGITSFSINLIIIYYYLYVNMEFFHIIF